VEERLLEADYFIQLMRRQTDGEKFGYCLNAFLSAARSVTFLLQKEMSRVPGFDTWWVEQQELLGQDRAARFFLKLRNYSQKEGRISLVGSRTGRRWIHRFAGNAEAVPSELLQRDVVECCIEHVAKLAKLALGCADRFPFHSCPRRAITPEGMQALQLSSSDLWAILGFDAGWIEAAAGMPYEEQIRLLREHVDGLDFDALKRLSRRHGKKPSEACDVSDQLGEALLTGLVTQLEGEDYRADIRTVLAEIILRGSGTI
jgi:hypothetical protein